MNIEKWQGLVTAASPYSVPPGANVEQHNIQVRKPGQLTPRPGLSLTYQGTAGTVLSMYRATDGKDANDRLIICRLTSGTSGSSQSFVTLEHLTYSSAWTRQEIFSTAGLNTYRPSLCQDRHGHIYVFFGNGIRPRTFRNGIDSTAVPFGIDAPTVTPTVTPSGDGWFVERVDVLSSGTSYYTPPIISVSGGNPDRAAKLSAVVQAGSIVAVDVLDGGSNYLSVPTISVTAEQIGTGFFAKGTLVVNPAVYGFKDTTVPTTTGNTATFTSGALTTTHQYGVSSTGNALIAYRTEAAGPIQTVEATYNSITGSYTTLVPLTRASGAAGSGAYAKVQFAAASNSYKVGAANPTWTTGIASTTNQVSSALTGGTVNYQSRRTGWVSADDYFENTATANSGVADRFSYWATANIDSFWGLGFRPNTWRFAKSQVRVKGVTPDDWLGNNDQINEWGSYYFPDYSYVSYKMLVGPASADGIANEANWQTFSSPVQVANGLPYIDVPLQPAKKSDGSSFATSPQTVFPTVRVYLAYCPESWTVQNDNSALPQSGQNAYNKRFTPQSGQDRRLNFGDTVSTTQPNGVVAGLHSGTQNLYKRWWGQGYSKWDGTKALFPLPRPVVDFRASAADSTISVAGPTCAMVNAGTQMENATAFAIRFEQYNAYDYRVVDVSASTSWVTNGPASGQETRFYSTPVRKNGFGVSCTDFFFEASAADLSTQNAGQIQPGAIPVSPAPVVSIPGSGWTAALQNAEVYLPTRLVTATASNVGSWTQDRKYVFQTEELIAPSPQKTIGSISILSGGQNYFREPTILFRGGGGYGLKVQSSTTNGVITSVVIIDGGDGFSGDTSLYTDVQPAKLMPVLRGTMRGTYRCAYRYADYSNTAVASGTLTTTRGSDTATLAVTTGSLASIKPGLKLTPEGSKPVSLQTVIAVTSQSVVNVPTLDGISVGTAITELAGAIGVGGRYVTALHPAVTASATPGAANQVTVAVAAGIVVGMVVRGGSIPSNTFVTAISGLTITLSASHGLSAATTVTFGPSATMSAAAGKAYDGYATYGQPAIDNLVSIKSISGNQVTLAKPARHTATTPVVVRDMTMPIPYSDFSPIVDVDADASGSGRASTMQWSITGVTPPERATHVEFFRTSADQSLVFYRLDLYGKCENGIITIFGSDGASDEELFDPDRPAYAALPVVLPNGGLNAYRFGVARSDMAVAVSWQDRLWYGVSTSGKDQNTIFFSEYDEYESCPDLNELPIQGNLRTTDYLTALVPFGGVLMAMQTSHSYTVAFNSSPAVDAVVTLAAHRGCLGQNCWDIFDDEIYAADERGIYRMSRTGAVESLSEAVRDFFDEAKIWIGSPNSLFLRIDPKTGILRFFATTGQVVGYPNITLCYHISNKMWWTESWPNSLTCSCDYKLPATKLTEPIYGAFDGNIYQMAGLTDVAYRDISSITINNGGSGYTTPPVVEVSGGSGARLRAVVQDGKVVDVVILRAGWNYGSTTTVTNPTTGEVTGTFDPVVPVTVTGGGGAGASITAYARPPTVGVDANQVPILSRATVPWSVRTGPLPLVTDEVRGGDGQVDRSVTVTYQPTATSTVLALREFFNNSSYPRNNVMPRDRGTGFVHRTPGARTTLDMVSSQLPSGFATGLAKARFAGRSLTDMSSADRHVAIELSAEASSANSGDPTPSQALIYALDVAGVLDGGQ